MKMRKPAALAAFAVVVALIVVFLPVAIIQYGADSRTEKQTWKPCAACYGACSSHTFDFVDGRMVLVDEEEWMVSGCTPTVCTCIGKSNKTMEITWPNPVQD